MGRIPREAAVKRELLTRNEIMATNASEKFQLFGTTIHMKRVAFHKEIVGSNKDPQHDAYGAKRDGYRDCGSQ